MALTPRLIVNGIEHFIGLDLGRNRDHSVFAVIEKRPIDAGFDHFIMAHRIEWELNVRHLERIRLLTSYTRVEERTREIVNRASAIGRCSLIVDGTGVGVAVIDSLRAMQLDCELIGVTITGGEHSGRLRSGWSVPRKDLMDLLRQKLARRTLTLAHDLPLRQALVEEFEHFGESGPFHDDMVMAIALAAWGVERHTVKIGPRANRLL